MVGLPIVEVRKNSINTTSLMVYWMREGLVMLMSIAGQQGIWRESLSNDECGRRQPRLRLDWEPAYDMAGLIEAAWTYRRAADDPRRIWYPG
jgi:hypothetical protein